MKALYAVDVNTGQIRKIATLPGQAYTISSLNADETLIAGVYTEVDPPKHTLDPATRPISRKGTMMDARFADKVLMDIYTLDIKTRAGQVHSVRQGLVEPCAVLAHRPHAVDVLP